MNINHMNEKKNGIFIYGITIRKQVYSSFQEELSLVAVFRR